MIPTFAWYFLSLRGRVSRQEFGLGYVGLFAAGVVLNRLVGSIVFSDRSGFGSHWHPAELEYALRLPLKIVVIVLLWPLIAILVKRLHDIDVSGWWSVAVFAIPYVAPPMATLALLLTTLTIIGRRPGSNGSNRYGAQPRPVRTA